MEGPAFGAGMELACTCDLRVASEDAVFCMPPSRLGIVYAPEGLWRVARLCGLARARRMFFTGERVPAGAALEWRLVEQVAPKEEVVPIALAWAAAIAQGAPLAIQGMKRAFNLLSEPPLEAEGRSELRALRKQAFASEDAQEGQRAFKEKRPPRFKGR